MQTLNMGETALCLLLTVLYLVACFVPARHSDFHKLTDAMGKLCITSLSRVKATVRSIRGLIEAEKVASCGQCRK